MIYLSQISKDFTKLLTIGQVPASGAYSVKLEGNIKDAYNVTKTTFTLDGSCSDTLHSATGDTWHFYGLYNLIMYAMKDYNIPICVIDADFKVYNPNGTQYGSNIPYDEAVLFSMQKISSPTADNLLKSHCLTSSDVMYLTPNQSANVYLYTFSNDLRYDSKILNDYDVYYFDSNGAVQVSSSHKDESGIGLKQFNFQMSLANVDSDKIIKLVFKTTVNVRNLTIYNLLAPHTETFRFRNRWNVQEVITLPCSIESTPKTELELATCNDIDVPYDIEHTTEHTLKTSAIPVQFYDSLLQLLRSHSVEYLTPSGYEPIHFKEYELPRTTNPNDQITLEATFQINDRTETIYLT